MGESKVAMYRAARSVWRIVTAGGLDMDDPQILERIDRLVKDERELRNRGEQHALTEDELRMLKSMEVALDQLWDLLDQRRYARESGRDPEAAALRVSQTVEKYLQ